MENRYVQHLIDKKQQERTRIETSEIVYKELLQDGYDDDDDIDVKKLDRVAYKAYKDFEKARGKHPKW